MSSGVAQFTISASMNSLKKSARSMASASSIPALQPSFPCGATFSNFPRGTVTTSFRPFGVSGQAMTDTLNGFKRLAETTTEKNVIVWLNEYFG